jgi:hypothetical protein
MDDEKKRLLQQAARCRRLAASIADAEAAAKLKALAQEYEAKAEQRPEPASQLGRSPRA